MVKTSVTEAVEAEVAVAVRISCLSESWKHFPNNTL